MNVVESILKTPKGAHWIKADLHVHTPGSEDFPNVGQSVTPADIVAEALRKSLDLIAVTDHNTSRWCAAVAEAAQGTSLTVLPGVEISTPQGHLLAIFDIDTPPETIDDTVVLSGIDRGKLARLDVVTTKSLVDVCPIVTSHGGLPIAAHVNGNAGLERMAATAAERRRIYASLDLWGVEVFDPAQRDGYLAGKQPQCPRKLACIQGSDSMADGASIHSLEGIGNRFCWLKTDDRGLSGLKMALIDPWMRIRLPIDASPTPSFWIQGMWVTGGFLGGQTFRFSENVTCLIGDTGSGKSLAIELLRFCLGQQPQQVSKIRAEVTSMLDAQLGTNSTVHVLLRKGDRSYLVERSWDSELHPPSVQPVGESEPTAMQEHLDTRLLFPIKAFSQSEIIEYARVPDIRLTLTDDLIDHGAALSLISELKRRLMDNANALLSAQAEADAIRDEIRELPTLIKQREEIDKILNDPQVIAHQKWYEEQNLFAEAKKRFANLAATLKTVTASLDLSGSGIAANMDYPNPDSMKRLQAIHEKWQTQAREAITALTNTVTQLTEELGGLQGNWQVKFDVAEKEYQDLLATLDRDGVGLLALSEKRQTIEKRIRHLQERKKDLQERVLPRIANLNKQREPLLTDMQDSRVSIRQLREAKAKELSTKLQNRVRLDVRGQSRREDFRQALDDLAEGSRLRLEQIQDIASKCHPVPFVKDLLANRFSNITKACGVEQQRIERLWETVVERNRVEDLYRLQIVDVEDEIEVMFAVGPQEYKALEKLSHGQKCMVILMIAMAEGDFPLLVDQPEDALHAHGIETGIVETLRDRRGSRQCIFATRNANILVSADAEQVIALLADAHHGKVETTGALDRFDLRELVIYHVEGGPEALKRKQTTYDLRPR